MKINLRLRQFMVAKGLSMGGKKEIRSGKVKLDGGEQVGFQNHEVLPWQPLKFRFWSIGLLEEYSPHLFLTQK